MRLLFLGGTGNLSTACVREALLQGHRLTILTRGQRAAEPLASALHVAATHAPSRARPPSTS
jgi:uncharacterized protein YbjT (DUF2867 family)